MIFRPLQNEIKELADYLDPRKKAAVPINFLYWLQHVFQQLAYRGVENLNDQELEAILPNTSLEDARSRLEALSQAECERFAGRMDFGLGCISNESFIPIDLLKGYKPYQEHIKLRRVIDSIVSKHYVTHLKDSEANVLESQDFYMPPITIDDDGQCRHILLKRGRSYSQSG